MESVQENTKMRHVGGVNREQLQAMIAEYSHLCNPNQELSGEVRTQSVEKTNDGLDAIKRRSAESREL